MNYTYKFCDGTTEIIECTEEMKENLENLDHEEFNNDRTEFRHRANCEYDALENAPSSSVFDFDRRQVYPELYDAIDRLTPLQHEVIYHIYFEGKSERAIAAEMGIKQQSVHQHKVNALKKMRKLLKGGKQ